jgi:uncharacterized membrane protein YesL
MSAPSTPANRAGARPKQAARATLARLVQGRVIAALGSVFNFLALNLAVLIVSIPVVTVPVALVAVTVALDRWRGDGEDRVVREFFVALRSRPFWPTTLVAGVPLVVAGIGTEEVHYFAHGGEPIDWVCLGFGTAALFIAVTALGYVLLLVARRPAVHVTEIWSLSVRLAVSNFLATGPLFTVEVVGAALVALVDPSLLIIGLPLALLFVMRVTAQFGLRRLGLN